MNQDLPAPPSPPAPASLAPPPAPLPPALPQALAQSIWTDRRWPLVLALGTLIVTLTWHLPQELIYLSERGGEIFVTLVLAASFTYLLRPLVNLVHRHPAFGSGAPDRRALATLAVFVAGVIILGLLLLLGLRPITHELHRLWDWFFAQTPAERQALIERWKATIQQTIAPYQELLPASNGDFEQSIPFYLGQIKTYVANSVGRWFSHIAFIVELLLVPVLVFYFLSDGPAIQREASLLLPPAWQPRARRMAAHFDRVLDGYIRGQVIMCAIAWVAVTVGLLLLRVPYAFSMGLVAGLTRAVPVIGPLLGGVPLVLVCLITTRSIPVTAALISGFTAMHFLESKVLLPKIVGHEVDLHPVSVIVALLIGMKFFGFLGVFLAVPLAAVAKIVLTEWHQSQLTEPAPSTAEPRLAAQLQRVPGEPAQRESGVAATTSPARTASGAPTSGVPPRVASRRRPAA